MARPKPIIVSSSPLSMRQNDTSAHVDLGPIFDFFKRKKEEKAAQEAESKVQSLFDRSSGEITQTGGLQSASEEIFPSQAPQAQQFSLEALAEGLGGQQQPQAQQGGLDLGALARITQQAQNPLGQPQAAPQEQAPFRLENLLPMRTPQVDIPSQEVVLPPSEQQRAAFEGLGLTGTEGIKQRALGFGGQAFPEPEEAGDPKNAAVPEEVRSHLSSIHNDIPIPEGTTYGQLASQGIKAGTPTEVKLLGTPVPTFTANADGSMTKHLSYYDSEGAFVSQVKGEGERIEKKELAGSVENKKMIAKLISAEAATRNLRNFSDRLFTNSSTLGAKFTGGIKAGAGFLGGQTQLRSNYMEEKKGLVTILGKGVFGEDRMTDFDADRIEGLLPGSFDSKQSADFKMSFIEDMIEIGIQTQTDISEGTFDLETARERSRVSMDRLHLRRLEQNDELSREEKDSIRANYTKLKESEDSRRRQTEIKKLKSEVGGR